MAGFALREHWLYNADFYLGNTQIGTKARQGSFGACFFTSLNADSIDPAKKRETKVFSSRPGRRVWVADPQTGTVSSTLKFALGKSPTNFLQPTGCVSNEGKWVLYTTASKYLI